MEDKLDKIDSKIDRLDSRLDSVEKILVGQAVSIHEHIRRSGASEDRLEIVEKAHFKALGSLQLIGVLGVIAGIAVAYFKIAGL